jgi:hypothetical protein
MIWLAWRQHRKQALFTAVGLAVLAALMVPTGLAMHHALTRNGLAGCLQAAGHAVLVPAQADTDTCDRAFNQFSNQYSALTQVGILFLTLPLFVGLFWGAPIVARELEHGTHRLVWTQGISRRHWALVKIGLVGSATVVAATIYGLGMSWWMGPLNQAGQGRLTPGVFDMQGIAPIGYTLFAVALGVLAGTLWHKVLPAMAVTLAGYVAVRVPLTVLARRHYVPPVALTYPVRGATLQPNQRLGNWIQAIGIRDATGRLIMSRAQFNCPPAGQGACDLNVPGARNWELYQPASRFWAFQAIETGIFTALAILLLYLAVRRVRRLA